MKQFVSKWPSLLLLAALVALVVAPVSATAKDKPKTQREEVAAQPAPVWPPPPDQARLKWVAMYHDEYDVGAVKKSRFIDALSGATKQVLALSRPVMAVGDADGRIFVGDFHKGVFLLDPAAKTMKLLPTGTSFKQLTGMALDEHFLYVADAGPAVIKIFDKSGTPMGGIGSPGDMKHPAHICLSPDGKLLWVADTERNQILGFDLGSKKLVKTLGQRGASPGQFNFPLSVAALSNGDLVVGDFGNFRIQVLSPSGKPLKAFGHAGDRSGDFFRIKGVAVDSEDHIYVADASFSNIQVFDRAGQLLTIIGEGGYKKGQFNMPVGLTFSGDKLYIADQFNQRVQVIEYLPEKKG